MGGREGKGAVVIGLQYYLFGIKPFQKHKCIFWKRTQKNKNKNSLNNLFAKTIINYQHLEAKIHIFYTIFFLKKLPKLLKKRLSFLFFPSLRITLIGCPHCLDILHYCPIQCSADLALSSLPPPHTPTSGSSTDFGSVKKDIPFLIVEKAARILCSQYGIDQDNFFFTSSCFITVNCYTVNCILHQQMILLVVFYCQQETPRRTLGWGEWRGG